MIGKKGIRGVWNGFFILGCVFFNIMIVIDININVVIVFIFIKLVNKFKFINFVNKVVSIFVIYVLKNGVCKCL